LFSRPNVVLRTPNKRLSFYPKKRELKKEYARLQIWDQKEMVKQVASEPPNSPSQSIVSATSPSTTKPLSNTEKCLSRSTIIPRSPTNKYLPKTLTSQISVIDKSVPGIRLIQPKPPLLVFFIKTEIETGELKSLSYVSIESR
jgi:hypothetical protein